MKVTGIVRRIDDLGRIVVPKEIRKIMRIHEGDPLEIFTTREGQITLKKYSPIGELAEFAIVYADSIATTTGNLVCITDKDYVIAAAGPKKKDFEGKPLHDNLSSFIDSRKNRVAYKKENNLIKITEDDEKDRDAEAISTIICNGDAIGSVVVCGKEESWQPDAMRQVVQTAAQFLGKQVG